MPNALSKIRNRAKAILKKHPGKKYQTALKEAGREYRAGKISGKGAKKKSAPKKRKGRVSGIPTGRMGSNYGSSKSQYKTALKEQLGWLMATQVTAKTKTEKKKLQVKINDLKRQLKAIQ